MVRLMVFHPPSCYAAAMLTLLVVDDNESDYHFIEMALKECRQKTRVRWVSSGAAGLEYLGGEGVFGDPAKFPRPDVVIVDLNMPGMGGIELVQWMRSHPVHRGTPALVMSSSSNPRDIEGAYGVGANTYFVKPTQFEDFVALFQHVAAYWGYARTAAQAFVNA